MGTKTHDKNIVKRTPTDQKIDDLKREMEIIGKILSESWKTKIFIEVCKVSLQHPGLAISGYKLARLTGKSISTVYNFLHEMEALGIFKFTDPVNGIKKVRIKNDGLGLQIYSKIKMIFPTLMTF